MSRLPIKIFALAVAIVGGAIFALVFLQPSNMRSYGGSVGHSAYIDGDASAVFEFIADIDSWPEWQDDIFRIERDDQDPSRVRVTGLAGTVEYDVKIDRENREVHLETIPSGDLTDGAVLIQVVVTRRNRARLNVDERIVLQRDGKILDVDEARYRLFGNLVNSISEQQVALLQVAAARASDWDKFLGCWTTSEESLTTDGSTWEPARPAEWRFERSFDGLGIMDTYTSPPPSISVQDELSRQRGINLRIFDPNKGHWVATWLTTASTVPVNFIATPSAETMVMEATTANPQGLHNRITFFDVTKDSFEWKLELSRDRREWTEAYRIHGKRGCDIRPDPT